MLLAGHARVTRDPESPGAFVVSSTMKPLVAIVGEPSADVVRAAIANAPEVPEIVVDVDQAERVARLLGGWSVATLIIHAWSERSVPEDPGRDVRFLGAEDVHDEMPPRLRAELLRALRWSPMAAAFAEAKAVAFCYATSETETLWDVSIDTLGAWRRRGLATACAGVMIRRMLESGKRPVWGAVTDNVASLALANRMGFEPIDRMALVTEGPLDFDPESPSPAA